jgi:hypothetical protein
MAGASRAFEERERHLRSWLSMEKSLGRVVLRRPVELTLPIAVGSLCCGDRHSGPQADTLTQEPPLEARLGLIQIKIVAPAQC